jgi:hypothetical protein
MQKRKKARSCFSLTYQALGFLDRMFPGKKVKVVEDDIAVTQHGKHRLSQNRCSTAISAQATMSAAIRVVIA